MRKFFDSHVHCDFDIDIKQSIDSFNKISGLCNVEKRVFMSVPHLNDSTPDYIENPRNLFFKHYFSPNAYAYAGLEHDVSLNESDASKYFLAQAKEYLENGFDGIKLLEGKPSLRQRFKYKMSDSVYDDMFAFLEQKGVPITMHNADPISYWDKAKMDAHALAMGWGAGEMTKREMHEDIEILMKKFPKLRLTLAHMGFYTDEKEFGERFLGDYEFTMLDLTPGHQQYTNMHKQPEYWVDFFDRHQDRIVYGTDNTNLPFDFEDGYLRTVTMQQTLIRNFFETDWWHKTFIAPIDREFYRGIKLDDTILDKIYYLNAQKQLGEPKKINLSYLKGSLERALKKGVSDKNKINAQDMLKML